MWSKEKQREYNHKYYEKHHNRCIKLAQRNNAKWYIKNKAKPDELQSLKLLIDTRLRKYKGGLRYEES